MSLKKSFKIFKPEIFPINFSVALLQDLENKRSRDYIAGGRYMVMPKLMHKILSHGREELSTSFKIKKIVSKSPLSFFTHSHPHPLLCKHRFRHQIMRPSRANGKNKRDGYKFNIQYCTCKARDTWGIS